MSQQESTTIPPFINRIMSALLRSPFHGIVSRSVMLLTFTGRKSGKIYTIPISYAREGDLVTSFTSAKWSRNLTGRAPVAVRIKNKEYKGQADIVDDKKAVAEGLQVFLSKVRFDARYYQVKFDDDGQPNSEDVLRAAQRCLMVSVQLDDSGETKH